MVACMLDERKPLFDVQKKVNEARQKYLEEFCLQQQCVVELETRRATCRVKM